MDLRGVREVLEAISHKWDLLILAHLRERPLRYSELAHQIRETTSDLTEGVLSKNLKRLNANGLIHQESLGNHHRAWALTPRGRHMIAGLTQITAFLATTTTDQGEPTASSDTPHTTERDADGSHHDHKSGTTSGLPPASAGKT